MFFKIPTYKRDFAPIPEREWERLDENTFTCAHGRAALRVFRYREDAPWWAEGYNPSFESATYFWTAEQAMYWAEQEIKNWFD